MDSRHILYNNWMYYGLQNEQLHNMIRTQEKIVRCVTLFDVNPEQAHFIYFKRDCLYFELHRRAFSNCLVQMFSCHKVKRWLNKADIDDRCICCRPDYYEFKYDCERIKSGQLLATELISAIISTRSLSGGRCFFIQQLHDRDQASEDIIEPILCGESASSFEQKSRHHPFPPINVAAIEADALATYKSPNINDVESTSKDLVSCWNNNEADCLIDMSKDNIIGEEATPGCSKSWEAHRNPTDSLPDPPKEKKHTTSRQKRFIHKVTFKRDEKPSCSYALLNEDDDFPSFPNTRSKIPKPSWYFGFRSPK